MEKPNRGNTITIKLNNETPKVAEEPKLLELGPVLDPELEQNVQTPTPNVIEIDSEEIADEVILETAVAEELEDESFDWIIPESAENDIEEFKIVSSQKIKKFEKKATKSYIPNLNKNDIKSLRSIVISAVCAIVLGTGFGFLMLNLISTNHNNKQATVPVIATNQEPAKTNVKTASAVLTPFTAFVVQGGVFSSKESAKTTAQQLVGNGAPTSTVEIDGKQYLFIGVSDKIDTAKQLGSYYIGLGINDVWAHSISVPKKTISNVTANDKDFLESALSIYQNLSQVTTAAILSTNISDSSSKAISLLDQQITNTKNLKNADAKNLRADLVNALVRLQAYQKSKDEKGLTDAQQSLLNFLAHYYSM